MDAVGGAARRGRGRPRTLTRDQVVDAALVLLERDGPHAVTVRSVAASLGVAPAVLYTYIDSRDDLLDAMAARFLTDLPEDADGQAQDWREQAVAHWTNVRRVALAHPQLLSLARRVLPTAANSWSLMERQLQLMQDAGLELDASISLYRTLHRYTVGSVLLEVARGPEESADDQSHRWAERASALPPDEFPLLTRVGKRYPSASADVLFAQEIRRLIVALGPADPGNARA